MLEHTLHKVGVFYFWQIAEWSPEDVRYVDSQLTGFHGRIESDAVGEPGERTGCTAERHAATARALKRRTGKSAASSRSGTPL